MSRKTDDLGAKLEALAMQLAGDAAMHGVQVENRINAMKVLTQYFAATRKLKLKLPEEDDGKVVNFDEIKRNLHEAGA